jgi:hypothetical protein
LLLAAALVAAACRDAAGPGSGSGITLDQSSGITNDGTPWAEGGTHVGKNFIANPHLGDAIVATFVWRGTANTVQTVTDHLCDANSTPVGNPYRLVDYETVGGYSMATYLAVNVQGFPVPAHTSEQRLCVHAIFADTIVEGGMIIAAYHGVDTSASALEAHHSAVGSAAMQTVGDPGAVTAGAGSLVYSVTMADGEIGSDPPQGFSAVDYVSDTAVTLDVEAERTLSAGSVDPRWTWYFTSPHSWIATVLALRPASPPR